MTTKNEATTGITPAEAIYQKLHEVLMNIMIFLVGVGFPKETLGVTLIVRDSSGEGKAMYLSTDPDPEAVFDVARKLIAGEIPATSHGITAEEGEG